MKELRLRRAGPADLEALVDFNAAMARETEGRELDRGRLRAGVRAVLEDPVRGVYWIAEDVTAEPPPILGALMITTEWSDWRNAWFWWIQSVYVVPEARGQGVYAALHRRVRAEARSRQDVCGLRLYVERGNRRAARVYEREGLCESAYRLYEEDFVLGEGAPEVEEEG